MVILIGLFLSFSLPHVSIEVVISPSTLRRTFSDPETSLWGLAIVAFALEYNDYIHTYYVRNRNPMLVAPLFAEYFDS